MCKHYIAKFIPQIVIKQNNICGIFEILAKSKWIIIN